MTKTIAGLSDRAYLELRQGYGSDRAVFHAASAYKRGNILRLLCLRHGIDPDQE